MPRAACLTWGTVFIINYHTSLSINFLEHLWSFSAHSSATTKAGKRTIVQASQPVSQPNNIHIHRQLEWLLPSHICTYSAQILFHKLVHWTGFSFLSLFSFCKCWLLLLFYAHSEGVLYLTFTALATTFVQSKWMCLCVWFVRAYIALHWLLLLYIMMVACNWQALVYNIRSFSSFDNGFLHSQRMKKKIDADELATIQKQSI